MQSIGTSTGAYLKEESTQKTIYHNQKTQIVVLNKNESKRTNQQKQDLIKDYQKKIDSMSQIIIKLNKKIHTQKQQFMDLNQKLNKAINKLTSAKIKQPPKRPQQINAKQQNLRKQLQNELKRSKNLKKQLDHLKQTTSILNNQQKFIEMRNQISQKNKQIKQLKQKLKGYQRAQISQKNISQQKKQQELNKKVFQIKQENNFLKKKISQLKAKIQQNDKKNIQKNQIQSLNTSRKVSTQKQKQKQTLIKKQTHDEQIKKLQNQIKSLQSIKITLQKTHKIQIQTLKSKNRILNEQVQTLKQQIRRKNKQTFILEHKNNTMRKSHFNKKNLISSIGQSQNEFIQKQIKQNDKNQRYKTLDAKGKNIQKDNTFGQIKKQFLGSNYLMSDNYKKSDDSLKLNQSKGYKISQIFFQFFQEHILSMKIQYKYNNGQIVQRQTFSIQHSYSNIKRSSIKFQDYEYIKQLDIYCNKMIQFIVIKTSRQNLIQIGNQKNQPKCKKYSFNIKSHQKPIAFAAVTQFKKINDIRKQCLVSLGLIMKKKDVSILRKKIHSIKIDKDNIQTHTNSLNQTQTDRNDKNNSKLLKNNFEFDKNPQSSK